MAGRCLIRLTLLAATFCAQAAAARVLHVGPGQALPRPSDAARIARDGDTVAIEPGSYADCAVWRASRLRIVALASPVTMSGRTCAGKGIFVVLGSDVTVRGITFAHASAPGHNGAGIKMEGDDLTVIGSRFLHDENGILAGGGARSVVLIRDSVFIGNGACIAACAHAVYAGAPIRLLRVEGCRFAETRVGHHVKSRARSTVIRDTRIEDGPRGTASYLIDVPDGGNVLVERTVLEKGRLSDNPGTAITIGEESGRNPTRSLVVRDSVFRNDTGKLAVFVRNRTRVPARLRDNVLSGPVLPVTGPMAEAGPAGGG